MSPAMLLLWLVVLLGGDVAGQLEQREILVTAEARDIRIIDSKQIFFEGEFVFLYQWEDMTVTRDTPLHNISTPVITIRNKVENKKTYPPVLMVPEDNIVQQIVREVSEFRFPLRVPC